MDAEETIRTLQDQGYYSGQIVHRETVPGQSASFATLDVDRSVQSALRLAGVDSLYQHQADAIEALRDGNNVVLATPTASGKTLSYAIPGFERAVSGTAKMLYIAPQVALINDQYDTLSEFASNLGFDASAEVALYHNKLDRAERDEIKASQPDVLLTTPDMLHYSLLPYGHAPTNWRWLLQNLDLVAVDEVHSYRGVFGSHTSLVFRRLNRLCDYYQDHPQYVCCSATIGNPVEHAAEITGQDTDSYTLIDDDTSATGDRHWALWNPPLKEDESDHDDAAIEADGGEVSTDAGSREQRVTDQIPSDSGPTGERKSHHEQAAKVCADLVTKGHQTLVFTRTRQGAERYAKRVRHHLRQRGSHDLTDAVMAYHANLRADERTEVENGLKDGEVRGVWSTNALELGIDIGTLDAVILDGYPGSVMSTFQRAGRAGRGEESCLLVLVGSDNPLDQYVLSEPAQLFEADPERAVINPQNEQILREHIQCAANEEALTPEDEVYFGDTLPDIVTEAKDDGLLRPVNSRPAAWRPTAENPNWNVSIRSISDRMIAVRDQQKDETVTSLALDAALRDAHPEAIYLHQGDTYRITEVDYDVDVAYAEEIRDTAAYTQPLRDKHVEIGGYQDEQTLTRNSNNLACGLVDLTVRNEYDGYLRYDSPSDDNPLEKEFDQEVPAYEIETTGMYFTLSPAVREDILESRMASLEELGAGLHAVEHALISLLPREVLCDRGDVGGLSISHHPETELPTVFVHDGYPGGVGLAATAYDALGRLLDRTDDLIDGCGCRDGCPSCIHSPQCGNANRHLDKALGKAVLDRYT
jgi:DEAD/DEAH box helicase domain-containing protein